MADWQRNKTLRERMGIMFSQELATDVTFQVSSSLTGEPATIKAHKYMLISASPVFWSMFCGDLQETGEIVVSDVEPQAFKEMIRFIYTEQCNLSGDNVMHIIHASKKYDIPLLTKACVEFMDKGLDASNAFTVLEHSLFFNEEDLSQKCLTIIAENTSGAFNSDSFMDISQGTLAYVLASDGLKMAEIEMFKRCFQWAEKNKEGNSTRDALGKALYKIRFPNMTLTEFTKTVRPTNALSMEEQLSIYTYLSVPEEGNKPSIFDCKKRIPKDMTHHMSDGILKVGSKVRVKQSITTPPHSWGPVTHRSVGVIKSIIGSEFKINFPQHSDWTGVLNEMELA